ncbi:MAG: inositol monophosphatase [Caldilineaceae bacterium]|nr:inositol monophosphatase [Caldilineaceae bacterium]
MAVHPFDIEAIIAIVQKAGHLVSEMRRGGLQQVQSKSVVIDLVTEADLASEAFLRNALQQRYPQVGFWGEESNQQPTEEFFWLVDPIDGTTNFANGIPHYAVNVALCQGSAAILGVTLQLPAGNVYWAVQGQGAFWRTADGQQQRLQVNRSTQLNHALVATGFPYHRAESTDNNGTEFAYFLPRCQSVRCLGAAALDLAFVAHGLLAACWEGWLGPWDAAAGVLLVQEAGGSVTDYRGQPWQLPGQQGLIASNGQPTLHEALFTGIQTARTQLTETRIAL